MITRIEASALGHFRFFPEKIGHRVEEEKGLTFIICGLGSSMFNIVYGGGNAESIHDVINEFNGQPFAWWVPPSQHSPELTDKLQKSGFKVEAAEQAMICDLSAFEYDENTIDLEIAQATNRDQLNDFISVLEPYDHTARLFYEQLPISLLDANEKLFVGYKEDKPVVIGILYHQDDTAGIFSLLTDESQRGQGLGTKMMRYMMNAAKENGAKFASLSASSDSGFRIYERLGFNSVGRFECFEWHTA